jgi:hypothetical protein
MKIVSEGRPVTAMPFIHLGYLAASYVKPQGGLLLMGSVLVVAGVGMAFRLVAGKPRRGRSQTEVARRKSRTGVIGMGVLLLGIGCVVVAWKIGGRYYPHGERRTSLSMRRVLDYIDMCATDTPTSASDNLIKNLPTEAGEYDLAVAVENTEEKNLFADGWDIPMKLKVVVGKGQEIDYLVMSAGEDREWNTDDDFTSAKYAETWMKQGYLKRGTAGQGESTVPSVAAPSAPPDVR